LAAESLETLPGLRLTTQGRRARRRKLPTNDFEEATKLLIEGLAVTQGTSFALYHILMELVMRLAKTQSDPQAFIKDMFESISAKRDQAPLRQEKTAEADIRETLTQFFSLVERAVRQPGPSESGAPRRGRRPKPG
jgi:hypothetical protein